MLLFNQQVSYKIRFIFYQRKNEIYHAYYIRSIFNRLIDNWYPRLAPLWTNGIQVIAA